MFNLWGKIKAGLAIAGAVIIAIGIALLRGRAEGKAFMEAEQQRKRDALQDHYDEIDRQDIDPAGSYDRLRGMSADKDRR